MTTKDITDLFVPVANIIDEAHCVAFDGCHKIYVALDEHEANWFRENYEFVLTDTPEAMLNKTMEWYEESCVLRFVNGVRYNPDDPNAGFITLISQFEDSDEWDDDEDDEDDDDV